ncbi:MAG: 50S ribosomal protein L22 [Candidatus Omnitrophica bacterium]|nr:50S ribosomal protein L22 [Candidatus Omnitrophota bacterium]MCM8808635.1 50S ribosomal protein L22 [Candidatus Omnitrophota bacterium]MCM8810655.1 50S ribosomal protein L22 [Candidatus Omnitrophota bacterium]MCM8833127.1 50S ribosomal protein L22 [Candidatus Omnitrophota bacterium]
MEVKAQAKYVRIGPRKLRNIVDLIKGRKVEEAIGILRNLKKKGAKILENVIKSAENNGKNKGEGIEWKIKNIIIDGGPMLKRYRAAPMGRGVMVRKRTSHITVILEGEE